MRTEIDEFFANDVPAFTRTLAETAGRIDPDAVPRDDEILNEVTAAFEQVNKACSRLERFLEEDPALLKEVQSRFRDEVAPTTDQSSLFFHARTKPRGYPGDHAMLTTIYGRKPKSRGIGGYLDLYFLNTALGRGVCTRLQTVRDFLIEELSQRQGEVSILNVACGPAREYVDWPNIESSKAYVTCIDYDKQALEYVDTKVAGTTPPSLELKCERYNALRMCSAKANIQKFGRPDIIYSVGLFDYIPDKQLVPLLQGLYDSVNDGGIVYVAFKDCRRYDKTVYQWQVDWYFFQRTEEECRSLLEEAGFEMDSIDMLRDATGSIISFICRTKAGRFMRVDSPETHRSRSPASPAREPMMQFDNLSDPEAR